jgi:uncharacterized integral membrane protein
MSDLWLKIKAWSKGIFGGALLLYLIFFFAENSGKEVTFWYWFHHEPIKSLLFIEFAAFFAGVAVTLLAITTLRTVKQIRDVRTGRRTDKLEREMADMKSKAAMLQTRPAGAADAGVTVKVDSLGGAKAE